jgi:hypothetical protein
MEHSSSDSNPNKDDGNHDDNGDSRGESLSPARGAMSMMMKRDSIMADDLADFDPASLESEDDWRDIFDDDDGNNNTRGGGGGKPSGPSSAGDRSTVGALMTDGLDGSDPLSARDLMPPPATTGPGASDKPRRSSSSESTSSASSIVGREESSSIRPPLDHSITRRKKTSLNMDRIESNPPTWHSDAADMPHRQAMVQDM